MPKLYDYDLTDGEWIETVEDYINLYGPESEFDKNDLEQIELLKKVEDSHYRETYYYIASVFMVGTPIEEDGTWRGAFIRNGVLKMTTEDGMIDVMYAATYGYRAYGEYRGKHIDIDMPEYTGRPTKDAIDLLKMIVWE